MELFDEAVDLGKVEQQAFLAQLEARDAALQSRLAALLAADREPTDARIKVGDPTSASTTDPVDAQPLAQRYAPGGQVGHYELIREIGSGGMGTVYLARDTKLGRRVAIKFLHTQAENTGERFLAEARITARCSHDNIVVIYEVNQDQGCPYMVLEYLQGQTLHKRMKKGPLSAHRAVELLVPVVRALVASHAHQIIHRDLKPENVFLTQSGAIKVLDFGIAKCVFERPGTEPKASVRTTIEEALSQPNLTQNGAIIGTMPYMSPEQWGGGEIDHRSDIWAVGIMLWELVVGQHPLAPLQGSELIITAVRSHAMPSAHSAGVTAPLADVIDRCLKKDPTDRYESAQALLSALQAFLHQGEVRELDQDHSPYAGLNAFQESDASRFFGRSRDVDALLARLQTQPVIGVVGPSGVGKSSFVRAGVVPALKRSKEGWESFVIRPGRQPLATLAHLAAKAQVSKGDEDPQAIIQRLTEQPGYLGRVLRKRAQTLGRKVLLFIDQFEELYTLTADPAQRQVFTQALLGVADDPTSPLRVLLSIRSDFLDRVAENRGFMAELDKSLYFLVQPDRSGLREAITRPAEMAGYRFESPRVVDQMLDQLERATGALPLLQFAAARLWERRDVNQRLLTERSYQELGGVEGALAGHANAVLSGLTPQEHALVRAIFLQLVTPERTRALTSVQELRELWHEPETVQRLVDHLVDSRLLVMNTDKEQQSALVEIVHESLIRRWPMLAHWLDENEEDAQFLEQLKSVTKQWEERGRPRDLLWRGDTAKEAAAWFARYQGLLPQTQRAFLEQTIALSARTAQRKRVAVVAALVCLSILAAATSIGLARMRSAKQTIEAQYTALQNEILAKEKAQQQATKFKQRVEKATTEVEESRAAIQQKNRELAQTNAVLNEALGKARVAEEEARAETARAKAAEQKAREAQGESERAKARLDRELAKQERALNEAKRRVRELEKRVGKIHDDL